jgi:hypothetical protein
VLIAGSAFVRIGVLTYLLRAEPEVLKIVLPSVVSLLVGLVGGIGLGKIRLPGSKDE